MAPVSAWAHHCGIPLCRFLDDWLVSAPSRASCLENIRALLLLCSQVGIQVSWDKSDLVPSQRKLFLGMGLDSHRTIVFPSPDRVSRLQGVARRFLLHKAPPVPLWRSLLGHLASLERLVPGGCLWMRSLQWCLKGQWKAASDPDWWRVAPNRQCLEDLNWWLAPENLLKGPPFSGAPPEQTVYRCIPAGVEGASRSLLGIRSVDYGGTGSPYQPSGALSCFSSPTEVSSGSVGLCSLHNVRQLHSGGLSKELGGYSEQVPVGSCRRSSSVV